MGKNGAVRPYLVFLGLVLVSLGTGWGGARQPSDIPFVDPIYADMYSHYDLGVGGDQHYPANASRFFTNIVDNAVGDLDGDRIDDIVLLADCIPPFGAYNSNPPSNYILNFERWREEFAFDFLRAGDALFGVNGNSNLLGLDVTGRIADYFLDPIRGSSDSIAGFSEYAPPSPNIVAGMLNGYTGSDVAWLRGDGRGHFNLFFITPNNSPVTIRGGREIRLARLQNPLQTGLDIVLLSPNNIKDGYRASPGTNIQPFTGAGRILWLQNRGWEGGVVNSRLNFDQHVVAEYNHDRMPVVFYTARTVAGSPMWNFAFSSLNPYALNIFDVDGDDRLDLVVHNRRPAGANFTSHLPPSYPGTIYTAAGGFNLDAKFSANLPRPKEGDLFTYVDNTPYNADDSPTDIFWYRNRETAGQTDISTATFQTVTNESGGRLDFEGVHGDRLLRMRLAGNREALVLAGNRVQQRRPWISLRTSANPFRVSTTTVELTAGAYISFPMVADFNNDGFDELFIDRFDCTDGCIHKSEIYTLTPNGSDVTIDRVTRISHNLVNRIEPGDYALTDVNGDGLIDICLFQGSMFDPNEHYQDSLKVPDAAAFLINTGNFTFDKVVRQKQKTVFPAIGEVKPYNRGIEDGWTSPRTQEIVVSTGDFNRDGHTDFVRSGPNIPLSLFINNWEGRARVRVQAVASHDTDVHKEWTAIMGGRGAGAGVAADQNPRGGIVPRPVQAIISE
ncbi:MAG: hypothetical protein IPN19_01220 [Elusimicrobia bacterium]|nr:hypothetical protein [Elusimicrobiota bacterium]